MDNGQYINDAWVVNLMRPMDAPATEGINESSNMNQTAGTFAGTTSGGALGSSMGTWSGTFHGDNNVNVPSSATGMFDGHFSNGHVRGAFAADIK